MTTSDASDAQPAGADDGPASRLQRAQAAHDAGNYGAVGELLTDLGEGLGDGLDDAQRAQLQLLRARTEVDPVQVAVLCACLAGLCVVAFTYVL